MRAGAKRLMEASRPADRTGHQRRTTKKYIKPNKIPTPTVPTDNTPYPKSHPNPLLHYSTLYKSIFNSLPTHGDAMLCPAGGAEECCSIKQPGLPTCGTGNLTLTPFTSAGSVEAALVLWARPSARPIGCPDWGRGTMPLQPPSLNLEQGSNSNCGELEYWWSFGWGGKGG